MLLSLCLLLPMLSLSSQEICSAPGALPAPILYLSRTSTLLGVSVQLRCSVFSQAGATRVVFCKDGELVSSQTGVEEKVNYRYRHAVSRGSSGNYACGYEIKDSDNWVSRSQLSPARHLSVSGLALSPAVWAARCLLVLLLLVSAPVISFVLEKRGLPRPAKVEETHGGSISIFRGQH